ncbi:MAG: c-type cytochrome biogenesis protein CcsB [Nitrospirae bacterium]|nr:MAG: c-type cytochrome biogenesis protein CcsB [Nitrospirota bacterium]
MTGIEGLFQREAYLLTIEVRLYWFIALLYLSSTLLGLLYLFTAKNTAGRAVTALLWFTVVVHTLLIVFRAIEGKRPPFQTLYETLSWFAWSATITYLYVQSRWKDIHLPGLVVSAISSGACFFALFTRSPEIIPIPPALQSPWYEWHVVVAFASYAVFVVSFSVEVVHLLYGKGSSLRAVSFGFPEKNFHRYAYRLVLFGFPLLTFAIFSGAAWANDAWGRYWSWDPKETWSLITWTVYALYLHTKTIPRWRQGVASVINLLGFVCMVMTFIGVNWLAKLLHIPSMHTYAM